MIFQQVYTYSDKYQTEHFAFTQSTGSQSVKRMFENKMLLEVNNMVADTDKEKRLYMAPEGGKHLIAMIDDISLPMKDKTGA